MSATIAVRHTVADFDAWHAVYEEAEAIRLAHNYTGKRLLRTPGDTTDVFITHDFPTIADAQAFLDDPDFAAAMQRAGVTSAPRIEIYESV